MWWPWRCPTQTSLQRRTCPGECMPPSGRTIVFEGKARSPGSPANDWAWKGTRASCCCPVQGFSDEQSLLWVSSSELPSSRRLFLPHLPSLPLSFMVSGQPWSGPLILHGHQPRRPCAFPVLPWSVLLRGPELKQSLFWEDRRRKNGAMEGRRQDGILNLHLSF